MSTSDELTKPLRILWVRSDEYEDQALTDLLGGRCQVDFVDSAEAAMQALRREPFALVVSSAAEFQPFERVHTRPEAQVILETVSQGVCIVGSDGALVWTNPKMLSFPVQLRDEVCRRCRQMFPWETEAEIEGSKPARGRRFSVRTGEGRYFEVTATPVIDLNKQVTQVAAVVWDATRALRLQERIDAIDNAGRELVQLDAEQITRLEAHERLVLLEQRIIRYMHDLMEMENFTVYLLDKRTNKLELVLSAGMPLEAQNTDLYALPEGNGISGYAAHRGRSYICPDVRTDPHYLPGIPHARSALAVPLRLHDEVIGVFNVESDQPAAFTEDDRQTLEIFSRYVAISLHIFELLNTERCTTTGRLGSDVMAEITSPVSDILTEVESLIEDYIGHDDLRHRLNKISKNAVAIRDSIKQVTTPSRGIVGRQTPAAVRRTDPILRDKRVLVVDDEEVIRETVGDVLLSYGCEVVLSCNGSEAVELLEHNSFDLVLSDIKMPGANGYEVFAASKQADAQRPVILMTGFGYDPNHSIIRARQEGLSAVIFKPFKVDQLLGELRNALRSSHTSSS